jgi:peptidyl-prolyl cis-trans isomerase C
MDGEMMKLVSNFVTFAMLTVSGFAMSADVSDGKSRISVEQIKREMLVLAPQFRQTVTSSEQNMARFVESVLMNERVAEKARALGYGERPVVQAEISKDIRDILANHYLRDQLDLARRAAPNLEPLAREEYEVNKSTYLKPAAFWASHILLRVDPEDPRISDEAVVRARAQDTLNQLKNGADFAETAKKVSEERLAPKDGGDMGWVDMGRTVPPFEAAVEALKPGETSGLIRTRFGFHIIKLHEKRPSFHLPFAEVKDQIIKKLMDKYMSDRRTDILAQFEASHGVIIDENTMAKIRSEK